MALYVSRFSNQELKKGAYTAVRISLGTPKWPLGYTLNGEMPDLMPFGLLNKYDEYEDFKPEYFRRLDKVGVGKIYASLKAFAAAGRDVVLLCYEDIRKTTDWCHRTAFAEWWEKQTGEKVEELFDPSPDPRERGTGTTGAGRGGSGPKKKPEDDGPIYTQMTFGMV